MEIGSDFVVLDDHQARAAARVHGLPVTGTLGLLVRAKHQGLISEVRPLMHSMVAAGHYASDRLQEIIHLPARRVAEELRLPVIGSVGILLVAKEHGYIELVRPYMDSMRATSLYLSERVYGGILRAAGEA